MTIRISCGAFIRLVDDRGRFGLLGSRSKFQMCGRRVLTPVGGSIEATDRGKAYLIEHFGVLPETFEHDNDLMFRLDEQRVGEFRKWFESGEGLEPAPARREFIEELGPEEHNLLTLEQTHQCQFTLYDRRQEVRRSIRRGQEGVLTQCFYQLYRATVPEQVMEALVEVSERSDNLFEFVSADEIRRGATKAGAEIPGHCAMLL